MKILKLRFSNLNSVYGEWVIDFTNPVYQSDGIFAITGPTGSGKTTIMDAVCLALYGQTPRLGKISQGSCEIMSRKTGECFSEVEFESSRGRFRCHWSQKRSYLKPDGNLQAPKHEIADASTGNILESSKALVLERVEETTGMDFEQFTRSIMLAQGGFAAFLEAKPTERAPILEQITGTEIYSRISVKVHEKTREEKEKLELLNAGIDATILLSPNEISKLKTEIEKRKKTSEILKNSVSEYEKCLLWLGKINEIQSEISELKYQRSKIAEEKERLSDDLIRLERAKKASGLEAFYQDYTNLRQQSEKSKNEHEAIIFEIENLKLKISELSVKSAQAESELISLKKRLSDERLTITEVNSLDLRIEEENKTFEGHKRRHDNLQDKKKNHEENIENLNKSCKSKKEALNVCSEYLKNHENDSGLSENLGIIREKLSIICDAKQKLSDRKQCLDEIIAEKKNCLFALANLKITLELRKQECDAAELQCTEISGELFTTLKNKETEDLRKDREKLEVDISGFEKLIGFSQNQSEYNALKESLSERNLSIETEIKAADLVLKGLLKESDAEERVLRELEEKRLLAARIKSLEENRKELSDGKPCPLCGSLIHPYSDKTPKPLLETEDEAENQRIRINLLKKEILTIQTKTAGLTAEFEQNLKRFSDTDKELIKNVSEIRAELEKRGLEESKPRNEEYYSRRKSELLQNLNSLKELILKSESLKKRLEEAQKLHSSKKDQLYDSGREYTSAKSGFEGLEKEESLLSADITKSEGEISDGIKSLNVILSKFPGLPKTFDLSENPTVILNILDERKRLFLENSLQKEKISRELEILAKEREAAENNLSDISKEISEISIQLAESENTLLQYKNKRELLYGSKDPKTEEERLAGLLSEAEAEADLIKGAIKSSEGSLTSKQWQENDLKTEITRYSTGLTAREMVFSERLSEAGFSDENDFLGAVLPPDGIKRLEEKRDEISGRKNRIETMLSDRENKLGQEQKKALTDEESAELEEKRDIAELDNKRILAEIGGIERQIFENEEKKQTVSKRLEETASQKEICRRWDNLHTLIGSADGKKFRNFAQGLTFEIMIANANRQLERMNDRYILMHSPDVPLELCVIDNYQAGEIRSTRNLSGGESFIISLALALGLSNMASKNVRVDSLFLDEGFGTLDEDALETALETLAGLRQDGKLIGIISHVIAIRERIPAKIEVVKRTGGRSIIKGPGCTKNA